MDQLVDKGIVRNVADLYDLKIEDLMSLDRMGVKSAGNVVRNIVKSKQNPLPRVLSAMIVGLAGATTAAVLISVDLFPFENMKDEHMM